MSEKEKAESTAVASRPVPGAERTDALIEDLVGSAKTPQDKSRAYELATALQQSQLVRKAASLIANTQWGKVMSEPERVAFTRYCFALGADPLRHVDLLGGNPFINGDYYRDVISANPAFHHADNPIWLHDDPRLSLCVSCGQPFADKPEHGHANAAITEANTDRMTQRILRANLRVEHNVAEASPSVCYLLLHYSDGRGPFGGIGEVHPGKTASGANRDPIGLEHPRATAETRAWRECGEKAEATWFRTHARTLDLLSGNIRAAHEARGPMRPEERPPAIAAESGQITEVSGGGSEVGEG